MVIRALTAQNLRLVRGDVLAIASKIVSISENRIVSLNRIEASAKAKQIAKRWGMNVRLAELVVREADAILGGVRGFLLTLKDGYLTANAGVDLKNSPHGTATLWPSDPDRSARSLRRTLERHFSVAIGLELVDSRVTPMRLGTVGLAIGISGFRAIEDERKKLDLYGRRVRITRLNIADDLAASAHMLMNETTEQIGVVIVRNAPILLNRSGDSRGTKLEPARCLIASRMTRAHGH